LVWGVHTPPLPCCPSRQKTNPAVSGLESEYKGRARGQNLDATTPENKKIVRSLGFENHGLVIRSADGKVLWKQPDHEVKIEDVRRELEKLLAKKKWAPSAAPRAQVSARYSCASRTTIDPSPTADATRFIAPARTSPAAKTPGTLVSRGNGSLCCFQVRG